MFLENYQMCSVFSIILLRKQFFVVFLAQIWKLTLHFEILRHQFYYYAETFDFQLLLLCASPQLREIDHFSDFSIIVIIVVVNPQLNMVHRIYQQQLRTNLRVMINIGQNFSPSKQIEQPSAKKQNMPNLLKYKSEPKFSSLKQQILKIPKVKQVLQKDRLVFSQDIQKRVELLGSVKNQNYSQNDMANLNDLRKKLEKKTKRHKTNFKIPLTRKNIASLNCLVKEHIVKNQFFKNEEKVFLKQYEQTAPFDLERLKFMDDLNPIKRKYKEKFPDFKEGVLSKNKLVLEHVVLNRNIKREMKLDYRKMSKENGNKVLKSSS